MNEVEKNIIQKAWDLFAKSGPLVAFMFIVQIGMVFIGLKYWQYSTEKFNQLESQLINCQIDRSNDLKAVIEQNTKALEKFTYSFEIREKKQ